MLVEFFCVTTRTANNKATRPPSNYATSIKFLGATPIQVSYLCRQNKRNIVGIGNVGAIWCCAIVVDCFKRSDGRLVSIHTNTTDRTAQLSASAKTYLSPRFLQNDLQTIWIWYANSRAGAKINPMGPDSWASSGGCTIMCLSIGSKYASVFPLPVLALDDMRWNATKICVR